MEYSNGTKNENVNLNKKEIRTNDGSHHNEINSTNTSMDVQWKTDPNNGYPRFPI